MMTVCGVAPKRIMLSLDKMQRQDVYIVELWGLHKDLESCILLIVARPIHLFEAEKNIWKIWDMLMVGTLLLK